jgi:hypothetical protein
MQFIYARKAKDALDISALLTLKKDILRKVIIPFYSAWNSLTSPRSCHRSFQILVFLDQSAKILFNLEHQARFSLRGKKKESCLKFKIKES